MRVWVQRKSFFFFTSSIRHPLTSLSQAAESCARRVRHLPLVILSIRPPMILTNRLFYGQWSDIDNRGRTNLLVEQVSHHPPITAYVIENEQKGLRLVGHNAQKTSFSGPF